MNKKLFLLILLVCLPLLAVNLPGMRKGQGIIEYNKTTQESDAASQRDYERERKASLNKKPWMSDNIHDMESLVWSDPQGRDYADDKLNTEDLRYYESSCALWGPDVITEDQCLDNQPYPVAIRWIKPGSIIKNVILTGPGKLLKKQTSHIGVGQRNFVIQPYQNASYGSSLKLEVITISDEDVQDRAYADFIYRKTGQMLSDAELKESRESAQKYYLNKGCHLNTSLYCGECECADVTPTIYASSATIAPGGSITLYVDSGGLACPPYTWEVAEAPYSLDISVTENDLETVTLSAASGSCGSGYSDTTVNATVTVTDNCGKTDTIKIRNTAGDWGSNVGCYHSAGTYSHNLIIEDKRYYIEWAQGSFYFGPGVKTCNCDDAVDGTSTCSGTFYDNSIFMDVYNDYPGTPIVGCYVDQYHNCNTDYVKLCWTVPGTSAWNTGFTRVYYKNWECP